VEARPGCREGEVDLGSVEVLRPVGVPVGGGFLVAADISKDCCDVERVKLVRSES
jgi:hypothetical protein